ncbi:MAG: hypothetical protein A2600_12075 [Candidatus Lambdaproteobacteria bacterium RIFOXYD1_FULL_56_27]|uniref:CHAT domain-containing protein n=1 Tax=Candidatus Lambdaproteobacteria bacterium RIFOXYD2_FULL_56_26 TaxID=1817773 RepID=A0A1F6GX09_9PROT|nr:MAG: hypothetical protein A2426_08940 [Candidatus Lambdaproteobacteria bacterium RIFOXYC1_FULL_56_13]OGH02695.1 MAG: hypothetical protein A2557_11470 [Candidatus Lambdaproteobacteria bacterium RIFOXYD2_FULL_56_26]OGH07984.1 MAG: hypothetical protein A2600_12075 [Candidatus Lambdaproteobacteria bacterium RIFOXYD1_FULL_56_27]
MTAPLVVELSQLSVHIPKYQLEFPFVPPPESLTQAALQTYNWARKSERLQSDSTRSQREEVMRLLVRYGQTLFEALFPEALRVRLPKEGAIYIRPKDDSVADLPFELLFDGVSFISQTHGLVRLYGSKYTEPTLPFDHKKARLALTLTAHVPLNGLKGSPGFVLPVEEFGLIGRGANRRLKMTLDGDASAARLLGYLEAGPDLFLFSGFVEEGSWRLAGQVPLDLETLLQKAFGQAVMRGMRLVILATSDLLDGKTPVEVMGQSGVPLLVTLSGRVTRERINDYLSAFLLALARGEGVLRAHRQSVNQIQAALPFSWDWSWIRLHMAKELLGHSRLDPLRPFLLEEEPPEEPEGYDPSPRIFSRRPFGGNLGVMNQLISALMTGPPQGVIWLRSLWGQVQEEYVLELFRRLAPRADFSLSLFYYFRWGYHEGQEAKQDAYQLGEEFDFLWGEDKVLEYFDQSQVPMRQGSDPDQRYLLVYYPPDRVDPLFEQWLLAKRNQGIRVLILSQQSFVTELSTQVVSSDKTSVEELLFAFDDRLPEVWVPLLVEPLPVQMRHRTLLDLARATEDPATLELFIAETDLTRLWTQVFAAHWSKLSHASKRLLMALYLLRVKWPRESLVALFGPEEIDKDLEALFAAHLLERNLEGSLYWIGGHLYGQIRAKGLLPAEGLVKIGQDLMKKLIGRYEEVGHEPALTIAGVSYLLAELSLLGANETAWQRGLQFAKRVAVELGDRPRLLSQLLLSSVELSLASRQPETLERAFLSLLGVLEHLPLEPQALRLYEWLLSEEQDRRNWPQVCKLQIRLAALYAKSEQPERAKGHLLAATQLALDLPNPAERFGLLVETGLGFLELGEMEKLRGLLETAGFDPAHLNQENMSRLWLIDGYLLFLDQDPQGAYRSFAKAFNYRHPFISEALLAQTQLVLAQIHQHQGEEEKALESLIQAAKLFEHLRDWEQARQVHEEICRFFATHKRSTESISHLEWLYRFNRESGTTEKAGSIAHELGGLYFRIGDQHKSTDYYKKAQELNQGDNLS